MKSSAEQRIGGSRSPRVRSKPKFDVHSGSQRDFRDGKRRLARLLHWFHMHPDLSPLEHVDELHRLIAESDSRPVLLFKHSHSCGVSMEALDELVAHLNERGPRGPVLPAGASAPKYAMVTVQTHRAVSNAVVQKLGIRHETPQALLIREGRVVWSASHFRVTAAAVENAIAGTVR